MSKYTVESIQVVNPHKGQLGQPDTITQYIVVDERGKKVAGPFNSLADAEEECEAKNRLAPRSSSGLSM